MYILTIPSFQYIKMFPTDGSTTGELPHHSLSCNVIDNAQMLIIGGTFPTTDDCDVPEQFGVHNVDMGQQNPEKALWQIFVTNLTTYALPDAVVSAVGGSAGGGATKTAPDGGFDSPDLRVLMTRKARIEERTPTRSIPTSTGSPEQANPVSAGAIAGIAVAGAVAALTAVIGTVWFIRRRRRSQKPDPHNPDGASPATTSWNPHTPVTYSPDSPHPHSPFLQPPGNGHYRHPRQPVELPVDTPPPHPPPGVHSWLGPDGVMYELVTTPTTNVGGSTSVLNRSGTPTTESGAGTGATTAASSGGNEPQTKIDADGRLWVQVSPSPTRSPTGSPVGYGLGQGHGPAYYHHHHPPPHPAPQQQQQHGAEMMYSPGLGIESASQRVVVVAADGTPQELSTEPPRRAGADRALGEGMGWDAAHGRPRHTTFYHP